MPGLSICKPFKNKQNQKVEYIEEEKEEKWNTEKEEKKKMKRRQEEDRGLGVCGLFVHACACPSECQPVTLRGWL